MQKYGQDADDWICVDDRCIMNENHHRHCHKRNNTIIQYMPKNWREHIQMLNIRMLNTRLDTMKVETTKPIFERKITISIEDEGVKLFNMSVPFSSNASSIDEVLKVANFLKSYSSDV